MHTNAFALGIHYQFAKTDETLYCLLGIFPPAKLSTRSKYQRTCSKQLTISTMFIQIIKIIL